MSRFRSSGLSSSPAGSPSTTAVRPGPWDSPAVVKRMRATRLNLQAPCGRADYLVDLADAESAKNWEKVERWSGSPGGVLPPGTVELSDALLLSPLPVKAGGRVLPLLVFELPLPVLPFAEDTVTRWTATS